MSSTRATPQTPGGTLLIDRGPRATPNEVPGGRRGPPAGRHGRQLHCSGIARGVTQLADAALYDSIGVDYAHQRRTDPRWAERIRRALGDARTAVNVGAGAGSYEPNDLDVRAVEPSRTMIEQRPAGGAPVVRGAAEALPFRDRAFDAALAVLTVHHWSDADAGLRELRRVARRRVVVTWDPEIWSERFWLNRDYVPEMAAREEGLATLETVAKGLAPARVEVLPVPADCTDGFCGAYWKRPWSYLDPAVRGAISALARLDASVIEPAMARLHDDLESGRWREHHLDLEDLDELDLGYRLVISDEC